MNLERQKIKTDIEKLKRSKSTGKAKSRKTVPQEKMYERINM